MLYLESSQKLKTRAEISNPSENPQIKKLAREDKIAVPICLITVLLAAGLKSAYQTVKPFFPWQSFWSISLVYSRVEGNAGSFALVSVLLSSVFWTKYALMYPVWHGWRQPLCSQQLVRLEEDSKSCSRACSCSCSIKCSRRRLSEKLPCRLRLSMIVL